MAPVLTVNSTVSVSSPTANGTTRVFRVTEYGAPGTARGCRYPIPTSPREESPGRPSSTARTCKGTGIPASSGPALTWAPNRSRPFRRARRYGAE
eukprot:3044851-Pyramimonas_sp.AAC.1